MMTDVERAGVRAGELFHQAMRLGELSNSELAEAMGLLEVLLEHGRPELAQTAYGAIRREYLRRKRVDPCGCLPVRAQERRALDQLRKSWSRKFTGQERAS